MPFWTCARSASGGLPGQRTSLKAKRGALCIAELCLVWLSHGGRRKRELPVENKVNQIPPAKTRWYLEDQEKFDNNKLEANEMKQPGGGIITKIPQIRDRIHRTRNVTSADVKIELITDRINDSETGEIQALYRQVSKEREREAVLVRILEAVTTSISNRVKRRPDNIRRTRGLDRLGTRYGTV